MGTLVAVAVGGGGATDVGVDVAVGADRLVAVAVGADRLVAVAVGADRLVAVAVGAPDRGEVQILSPLAVAA